jgi:hypothetical protein
MNVKKYVEARRTELRAERERLASQSNGITTGLLMGFDQKAKVILVVLDELSNLADWEREGEPDFVPPLSAADREFWKGAKARGMAVSPEIEAQLTGGN